MTNTASRALIAALPMPAMVIDGAGKLSVSNTAAQEVMGGARDGLHYITALRQPAVLEAIERSVATKERSEARFLARQGGRDTTWTATVAPLPDGGVLLTFQDVSHVEEATQMRRDFVANVSHELRTPLTALLGFIETLKGAARDDAAARARFLDIMSQEAGRMAHLVDDLLSLSRVEESERVRPMHPVSLRDVICETCNAMQGLAVESQVVLDCELPEGLSEVPGDKEQLRQVLTNLVQNALKYGSSGGRVVISATEGDEPSVRGQGVRLSVRDFGEGIAPHHLARLTERFYRVDSHRSREVGGTGLGLAIVKHIINRHRGRLKVESTVGQGSCFSVILPLT